jgi:hypothetical protein
MLMHMMSCFGISGSEINELVINIFACYYSLNFLLLGLYQTIHDLQFYITIIKCPIFKNNIYLKIDIRYHLYKRVKTKIPKRTIPSLRTYKQKRDISRLAGLRQLTKTIMLGFASMTDKSFKFNYLVPYVATNVATRMYTTIVVPINTQYCRTKIQSLPLKPVAYTTYTPSIGPETVLWDTDSYPIRVDNCCTRTISFNIKDFDQTTLEPVTNRTVSGFVEGSTTPIEQKGTIKWRILDDLGVNRELTIPNSFYVPGGTSRLLSPQNWAQEAEDDHGTRCITNSQSVVLEWSQRQFVKTIQLDPEGNNVGTMWSAPGVTVGNQVIEYMTKKFPNICFSSETIEIINQDPYESQTDEDGLHIELSDDINNRILSLNDDYIANPEAQIDNPPSPLASDQNQVKMFDIHESDLDKKENFNRRILLH